ncbi:MAG: shikimate kinase [Coriobacteriales bacterium]|jgi:shikimate kinase|nr:shikimate kinase [Coriobacteriales bacterium]
MTQKAASHIVLIGFMGSGKSSVARRLARQEKMNSIDMDVYIEREAGMTIPQIFETEGEAGFREREAAFLVSMFARDTCILSCGGGTITRDESCELVKQLGTVVYLQVSAAEAVSRISHPETRPLLGGVTSPEQLLASRVRHYEDAANITIDTSGKSLYKVAQEVTRALREAGAL